MKYLFSIGFFCAFISLQAQTFSREVWYDGKIVLDTEDTLAGNIRFDLADNLLQLETGGVSKAYSARNVISFEIFDEVNQVKRHYYALPYGMTTNYKVPVFFELLTQGELTLLCREKLVTETMPMYGYNPYGYGYGMGRPGYYNTRNRIAFDFFFGYPNGNIKPFLGNKKDFFYLVKDHQQDIKDFIRERKLRYNEREDLTKIVSYYNYLKGK
jgi:hypothetical protein